jgi:fatty acid synthase, animal type
MGHGESAAGLCSLAKIAIIAQAGAIPPNLHFHEPNGRVKDVFDGSLEVVTERTPFDGGLVGVSAFGIGGTNAHVILEIEGKSHGCRIDHQESKSHKDKLSVPILIPFSGRTEVGLKDSLRGACESGRNPEFASLLHGVFRKNIPGHFWRGFGVLSSARGEPSPIVCEVSQLKSEDGTRPLWFVFPGEASPRSLYFYMNIFCSDE